MFSPLSFGLKQKTHSVEATTNRQPSYSVGFESA
jgi:hypothetical protein